MPDNLLQPVAASGATPNNESLAQRLREAALLLEKVAADRTLLAGLSAEEHSRLIQAAGDIFCPDVSERRRFVKAKVRQRKEAKIERDQSRLNETGIRKLRREKVFTTPNVYPPADFQQIEVEARLDGRALTVGAARLEGTALEFSGPGFAFRGRVAGARLEGELSRDGGSAQIGFERAP